MTKFADELFNDLIREHGPELAQARPPAAARRPMRARRVWLGAGTASLAAGVAASVVVLGGSPAYAAYSVTPHADGTVSVSVNRASGVARANAALHRLGAPVVVVPVRPGCAPISSLPHPAPGVHPKRFATKVGRGADGHLSISVQVRGMPAEDIMVLAFSPGPGGKGGVGAGGADHGPGAALREPARAAQRRFRGGHRVWRRDGHQRGLIPGAAEIIPPDGFRR